MIEPNIYCKVSGMVMRCIAQLNAEGCRLPTVVEVGCADGQGTMRYAGFVGHVVAVDAMLPARPDIEVLPDGRIFVQHIGVVDRSHLEVDEGKVDLFSRRVGEFPVSLVVGLSTDPTTVDDVRDALLYGPSGRADADIVVIDGCHHPFEAVWADVALYHQFVRPGGFIILDDLYEDCIQQCLDRSISDLGYTPFDRWAIRNSEILQDCAALRRPI